MSEDAAKSPSGREGPDHGPTVLDGVVRRTSVSALQTADDSTDEGCLRKWWYHYVRGLKEPQTEAQANGTRLHSVIERYLRTGEKRLPDVILKNLHIVQPPGPDLLIEHPLVPAMPDGSSGLHLSPVRAAGIPLVGFIDLVHDRLTNLGGADVEDTQDSPGTVEVIDWKFTLSMDYAKTPAQLPKTIQMAGYGKWAFETLPDLKLVRLSHGYMPARGRGAKPTIRVDRDVIERSWEHADSVARSVIDAARETDPDRVPANRRACNAYNKKCIHAQGRYCTAGMHNSLREIANAKSAGIPMGLNVIGNSILDKIRQQSNPAPQPTSVAATIGLTGTVVPPVAVDRAAEIARLQAEEAEQIATRAFEAVCDKIVEHQMGFPHLTDSAAALYVKAKGAAHAPSGQLGSLDAGGAPIVVIPSPEVLAGLLGELENAAAKRAAVAASSPAPSPGPAITPPEAPLQPITQAAATVPTAPAPTPQAVAAAESVAKKTRGPGRPKTTPAADAPPGGQVILLVDGIADGVSAMSLHGLIDELAMSLANEYNAADIRCASNDTPLGFGKWTGAYHAHVRDAVATLAPGVYAVDTRGSQLAEIFVDALRSRIRETGGFLFRGAR